MNPAYTRTAIALHWLAAALIFAVFPLGLYMSDLALSPLKLKLFSYHKWLGVTVFLLAAARVAWRVNHLPPPLPDSMARWQQVAAHGLHLVLYVLLFAIPLCGWLMSSAKGFQTVYLGLLPLPDLVGKDKALAAVLQDAHTWLSYFMAALVAGHIAISLKHQYVDRDGVLARMLPFLDQYSRR